MSEQIAPLKPVRSSFQFSILELLGFTFAVSIYFFVLMQFLRWSASASPGPSKLTQELTIAFLVGGAVTGLIRSADQKVKQKLGSSQIRWRRPLVWRSALQVFLVCLLASIVVAHFPTSLSVFLGMLVGSSTMFFAPIRIGDNGISYQLGTIVPWSQCVVDSDRGKPELILKDSRKDLDSGLLIPVAHFQQVEQILREKGKLTSTKTQIAPCDSHGAK